MAEELYIIGDGDNIRERMEALILNHRLGKASAFSKGVAVAIDSLREEAKKEMDANIIFAGGDDILFLTPSLRYNRSKLERIILLFEEITGATISFGVGSTIESAYINLRRAKALGSGQIVEENARQ